MSIIIERNIKQEREQIKDVVEVFDYTDFPYGLFAGRTTISGNKRCYQDMLATFDIETTSINYPKKSDKKSFGFMYVWQFCIDGCVCMGRSWEEYKIFLERLKEQFNDKGGKLVCYVHNLNFEFQFLRNFFTVGHIFAKDERNVIKADIEGLEYRCSYALTNMGLQAFTNKTKGVIHKKLDGEEFDYTELRFSDTELTEKQIWYCVCDVLGLYEGLKTLLEEDTIITIPMTSTGYVRRSFREACKKDEVHMKRFQNCRLTPQTYTLCKEISRGGISGSNHIYTSGQNCKILENVKSKDIKSSYPYQMMTKYFPQCAFINVNAKFGTDRFDNMLAEECCIILWECKNLKIKKWSGIPYISKAKCRAIVGGKFGNGKVYSAKRIGIACTEIDFKIICEQYNFDLDSVIIHEMYCAGKDLLSKPFRQLLCEMFQTKTDLEDGDKYLYAKYKNRINAAFGMMLTDITNPEIEYNADSLQCWQKKKITDLGKALKKYYGNKNSFLTYQHGVWVTAHARRQLVDGMNICGSDIVQVDTDSCKYLNDHDAEFDAYNSKIIEQAESYDVKPYSIKNGKKHYLGIWENDGDYKQFATLGAKKYAYDNGEGVKITVAGLNKETGAKWFDLNGGIEMFKHGTTVPAEYSGRTCARYNDKIHVTCGFYGEHEYITGSNIAIENIPYTLGVTSEWYKLILDGVIDEEYCLDEDGAWEWNE